MKICIPVEDDRGMDSRVADHFGSAPFYAFADTATGRLELVRNRGREHRHGSCDPAVNLESRPVDAVVCPGMGKRAFASLGKAGISVFVTPATTVHDVLSEVREGGKLRRLTKEEACGGHGHGRRGSRGGPPTRRDELVRSRKHGSGTRALDPDG
jgi:predicted Fe-Mo cluster-binding NifX family protein